ncbi:glycosyltransferase family 4 protein [Listeria rocourtiae]|uniref:glycosyltransferase family 4 protein n=1 Tax=Listeria rocourtiae TaxID=647910 RepID=UPI003D2F8041
MKPKLVYVVTAARSIKLLDGQLAFMAQYYDVHLIASSGPETNDIPPEVTFHALEMEREISIWKDVRALFHMMRLIRQIQPDVINYGTPKASLLASISSKLQRVPKRIYTLRGLRLETITGKKGKFFLTIEKWISAFSHRVICISPSLLEKAEELGVAKQEKLVCAGYGSSNGMNMAKFEQANQQATELLFTKEDIVLGYVGRLTQDKGIDDLIAAFQLLKKDYHCIKLLLVGRLDSNHHLQKETVQAMATDSEIIHLEYQKNIAPIYQQMDIFVFPTYREGFGNVAMEASYSGLPVIATNVTGAKDTIIPHETGLLVEAKNPASIQNAVMTLLQNPERRQQMGQAGKARIKRDFQQETIWQAILEQYTDI